MTKRETDSSGQSTSDQIAVVPDLPVLPTLPKEPDDDLSNVKVVASEDCSCKYISILNKPILKTNTRFSNSQFYIMRKHVNVDLDKCRLRAM